MLEQEHGPAPQAALEPPAPVIANYTHYGSSWGESAARCYRIEQPPLEDIFEDAEACLRLMPIPESCVCPITMETLRDPVATVDGSVYERSHIEHWIRLKRQQKQAITSPATGVELRSLTLVPLVALREAIETYLAHRPELRRERLAARSVEEVARLLEADLQEKSACRRTQASETETWRRRVAELEEKHRVELRKRDAELNELRARLARSQAERETNRKADVPDAVSSPCPARPTPPWVQVVDDVDGKNYFWNPTKKATTYRVPDEAVEWMALRSSSGEFYYWNRHTQRTSWKPPTCSN